MSYLTMVFNLKTYDLIPCVNALIDPNILCDKQNGFYSLEKNSLDVVFIGSSAIHGNINPNLIWNEYGITSYDFSSDKQELGTTYYYLQQMFETQSPKVVVIDIYLDGSEKSIAAEQAHFSFDHMKNDIYKAQAIWTRSQDNLMEMYFPIIAYHDRWSELNKSDFEYRPNQPSLLKGSFIFMERYDTEGPEIPDEIPVQQLSERTLHWLDSIRLLCEKNNTPLVFIKTPFTFYNDHYQYYAAVEEYSQEYGIPFLFLNKMIDEVGIDFKTDFGDIVHLNWLGQVKFSSYLGKYLQENYHIENKKGLPEYAQWDEDFREMMYYVSNFWELYPKLETD